MACRSPHQPCKRAWHLLLHIFVTVADVGQAHLADHNGALVEDRKVQPGISLLHVLEVALQPQALGECDGRLVVHLKDCRRPDIQQPELCKGETKSTSLLAGLGGRHVLRLGQRQRRTLDAVARPGDCGLSEDKHIAARARPVLLVSGVVGVHVADQLQQLWSTAKLQGSITGVGEVGEAAVDLAPVLVAPHREAAPQLAAGEGDVRPRRRCRELQQADLLLVLLLLALVNLSSNVSSA
ncbi:unnamed protein product [Closterium sp. NIES-54]